MNKIAFVILSVVVVLVVFVGLIFGAYWTLALPAVVLIGYWIAGSAARKKKEEGEIEEFSKRIRKL